MYQKTPANKQEQFEGLLRIPEGAKATFQYLYTIPQRACSCMQSGGQFDCASYMLGKDLHPT